jgi:hypothetical protein
MGDVPEPPFIGNLLSYILLALLIYLLYYSYRYRDSTSESADLPGVARPKGSCASAPEPPRQRVEFYIEPSPIEGQKIPFPSIYNIDEELDLSIVVPVKNCASKLSDYLQPISEYFAGRTFTYEIIVVDCCSSDGTHANALTYANEHQFVRVLRISRWTAASTAIMVGCTRTRGRWIFLYNPGDGIDVAEFAAFETKLRSLLPFSREALVAGAWRAAPEDFSILRSTFNIWLQWLTERFLSLAGVKESACKHARTFLMTRPAAQLMFSLLKLSVTCYDHEILVLAARIGMEVKSAKLNAANPYRYDTPSEERLDEIIVVAQALLTYVGRSKEVTAVRARLRSKFVTEL